jgi:hypothetical protein
MIDFEPVVVTRTSPEGRMMSKWLVGARKKIGGPFPRPDARKQMERYAQVLKPTICVYMYKTLLYMCLYMYTSRGSRWSGMRRYVTM